MGILPMHFDPKRMGKMPMLLLPPSANLETNRSFQRCCIGAGDIEPIRVLGPGEFGGAAEEGDVFYGRGKGGGGGAEGGDF